MREELPHLRVALISIFRAAVFQSNWCRVLHIRNEVRDGGTSKCAANAIVVRLGRSERQVTAVARTREHDPVFVESGLGRYPVQQRANVFHRVLAAQAIIEPLERTAEAGRSAYVRIDQRNT